MSSCKEKYWVGQKNLFRFFYNIFFFFFNFFKFAVVFRSLRKSDKVPKPSQQKLIDTKGHLQLQRTPKSSETYTQNTRTHDYFQGII